MYGRLSADAGDSILRQQRSKGMVNMKIRTDFVTNSSSASFILELNFEGTGGNQARMSLAVSPEVCLSDDGGMKGEAIYLRPKEDSGDILVGNRSIYDAKDTNMLCDLLFDTATIEGWREEGLIKHWDLKGLTLVLDGAPMHYKSKETLATYIGQHGGMLMDDVTSDTHYLISNDRKSNSVNALKARELGIPIIREMDFMYAFDEENYDYDDPGIMLSVKEVAPITTRKFKEKCADAGITLDTLKTIDIRNSKFGSGDSAMWIDSENNRFVAYRTKYRSASDEEKAAVFEELIAFVKSEPELEVCDNDGYLPERMYCVWDGTEEDLRKSMMAYLEGKVSHWMGTYSQVFTIDVTGKSLNSREVLYFGDL